MPKYIDCNLCGSGESKIYHKMNSSGKTWNIVQCKKCGLIYLNPQPSPEEIKNLYLKDYFDIAYLQKESCARLMSDARELLKEIERYRQPGKILDIGAAGGHYLKAAQERGWETFGVELSSYATSWAKENLGLKIFTGILEEANFPDDFFDVIIMSHTLEHLFEPLGTLRKAYQILKNNGLIYINVPNVNLLKTQIEKRGKLGALSEEEHLFWFSLKTLKAILEKAGFKIIRVRSGPSIRPSIRAEVLTNVGISAVAISKTRHLVNKYFSYPKEILLQFIGKIIPRCSVIIYAKKEK